MSPELIKAYKDLDFARNLYEIAKANIRLIEQNCPHISLRSYPSIGVNICKSCHTVIQMK